MTLTIFNPEIALVVRIVLGLLFLVSGALKFPDMKGFFVVFVQFGVLKGKMAKLCAYSYPFIEVVIGGWLMSGIMPVFSAIAGISMLIATTGGIIFALVKKKKIDDCGCYGIATKSPLTPRKLAVNTAWLMIAAYILIAYLPIYA